MGNTKRSSTVARAVTTGRGKGAVTARQQPVSKNVAALSESLQTVVRQMLVDGATFEDVAEAILESGEPPVPLRAIESYFRSNLDIQKERITRRLQTAKALRESLSDPKSGHAELAEAVLITGLMGVNRRSVSSELQHAMRVKDQHVNQSLKEQAARLQVEKFAMDKKLLVARLRAEKTKQELVRTKLSHLKQALEGHGEDKMLGPEIIQQIHEIYGIVSIPDSLTSAGEGLNGKP
ncbi:MAG: hypothetical protein ACRD11_04770 [Terriglobia bacterium]